MYNKYFTMKRSELKEAIKAEITSVLSEQSNNPDFDKKVASFARKINNEMDYPGGVLEAMKQIKSRLERIISKVEGAKRGGAEEEPLMKMIGLKEAMNEIAPMGPGQTTSLSDFEDEEDKLVRVSQKDVRIQLDQYENGKIDGDELAQGIEEIVFGDIAPRGMMKEDEMTDAEKKKAAEKNAKKETDFTNKQKEVDKLKKELADNKDELVKIAKISRNERTKAQQNLFDDMAKKTKELKKLKRVEI